MTEVGMIKTGADSGFARLAAALQTRARALAAAQLQNRALLRSDPARRWRSPALLWPLFTKD